MNTYTDFAFKNDVQIFRHRLVATGERHNDAEFRRLSFFFFCCDLIALISTF